MHNIASSIINAKLVQNDSARTTASVIFMNENENDEK